MDFEPGPAKHDDPSPQSPAPKHPPAGSPALTDDERVDQAGLGSFPASDPAPWTTGREPRLHTGRFPISLSCVRRPGRLSSVFSDLFGWNFRIVVGRSAPYVDHRWAHGEGPHLQWQGSGR
jgi:hypothetical protein